MSQSKPDTPAEDTQARSAADSIVELLANSGVQRVYTVPGESFLPVIDAVERRRNMTIISTRHESGAAFMAGADARISGRPTAVLATRAVGASNLAIGIHDAYQGRVPVIALIGQVPTKHRYHGAFQELDVSKFYSEITDQAYDPGTLGSLIFAMRRVVASLEVGRSRPVAVALPEDLLAQPVGELDDSLLMQSVGPHAASRVELNGLHEDLCSAAHPVMIVGHQREFDSVKELAHRYGIGVYTAFRQQDSYDNFDANYLGHLTLNTDKRIVSALDHADLVISVGETLDQITTQGYVVPRPRARHVHIGREFSSADPSSRVDAIIQPDIATVVDGLRSFTAPYDTSGAPQWVSDGHETYLESVGDADSWEPDVLHPGTVVSALKRYAPHGTIVVSDAGNFSVFVHRQWQFSAPQSQAAPVSGAMGYAVPGSIGAALASPGSTVVSVAGDGGFLMTGVEIETAVRLGLNVKYVVNQNCLYGTIQMHQRRGGFADDVCTISKVDIAGFARSLGAQARTCGSIADLDDAARWLFESNGVVLLAVETDPRVILPGVIVKDGA